MIKLGVDLFTLAEKQLIKERRKYNLIDVINYAIRIRKYLDMVERNKKVAKNRKGGLK